MKNVDTLDKFLRSIPKFMYPELDRVETLDDLLFQVSLEIDLAEEGNLEPEWTAKQLRIARMFAKKIVAAGGKF